MSIRKNATYNIVGAAVPLFLSLATVPLYLSLIGAERYGVLAIAWLMLGYFGGLDLGLGRATSFRIAALRDAEPNIRANALWSALVVNLAVGAAGAAIFLLLGKYFFGHLFKISPELRNEILAAVPLLALAAPVSTITGVLNGTLVGRERFLSKNVVSTVANLLFQFSPVLLAWLYGPNLFGLLLAALSSRLIGLMALIFICYRELIGDWRIRFVPGEVINLLKYGGWINVVSIVGPLMQITDRFAIGAVLGSAAVTAYTIPVQISQRIAVLPSSLTNAVFPRMSGASAKDRDDLAKRTNMIMVPIMTIPTLAGIFLMEPFLNIWVGPIIGSQSAQVGRILLVAYWLNAFALVPFVKIQASGRPDIVAKFVLAEVPVYLIALYFSLVTWGYEGCAIVFLFKCLSDYLWLNWLSDRKIPNLVLILSALGLLLLGLVAAESWSSMADWRWWFSGGPITLALATISWRSTPVELRNRVLELPMVRSVAAFVANRRG